MIENPLIEFDDDERMMKMMTMIKWIVTTTHWSGVMHQRVKVYPLLPIFSLYNDNGPVLFQLCFPEEIPRIGQRSRTG